MYPSVADIEKDLLESEKSGNFEILQGDRLAFNVFDVEYGRYLRISKRPMSKSYLESIIHKDPDINDIMWPGTKWIAKVLSEIDPRELMFVKHIFIAKTEEAFLRLARDAGCDVDMAPDGIFGEGSPLIGQTWHYESAVIVDWQTIADCAEEISDGSLYDMSREARIGVASTLVHECRHVTAEAPWYYYVDPVDPSEEAVENYTRFQTDRLIAMGIIP